MQIGVIGPRPHGRQHRAPPHARRPCLRGLRPRSGAGPRARRARARRRPISLADAGARRCAAPRAVWVMLPAGRRHRGRPSPSWPACSAPATPSSTAATPSGRTTSAAPASSQPKGIHYLDVGTSGGVWGLERGYCLMIGGDEAAVERLDPIFAALAPGIGEHRRAPPAARAAIARAEQGYLHCGPERRRPLRQDDPQRHRVRHDAGHRRGLRHPARTRDSPTLPADAALRPRPRRHRRGLAARQRRHLLAARPDGGGAGRGRHARAATPATSRTPAKAAGPCEAAIEEAVPAEVLTAALYARFRSRQDHTFAEKVLSAMRKGFGGHVEPKTGG